METFGLILGFVGFIGAIIVGGLMIYSIYNRGFKYKTKQLLMIFLVFMMSVVIASEILWSDSYKQSKANKSNTEDSGKNNSQYISKSYLFCIK